MRTVVALIVLMVLLGACDGGGVGGGGTPARSSSTGSPGEQVPGDVGYDLGFSARADLDDAVGQPWRVPCVEEPLAADAQRRAARGLTQDATKYDAMLWTKRTFVVYPDASVARKAVRQLTSRLLNCPTASRPWRMDRMSLGDQTLRFIGRTTLAKPERDARGDLVRKEYGIVFVTRTGRTVLATSVGSDVFFGSPLALVRALPLFVQHPAAVEGLCSYADHPCRAPAPLPADDRDKSVLPTRDSLQGLLPDPVPGHVVTGDAAAAPFGCRQQPLSALHVASAVRREYTGGAGDYRLVVVAARFADQHAARSAEVLLENWMGDCGTAFDRLGVTTADQDFYDECRPEPLVVRRGEGVQCSWKYYDGRQGRRTPGNSLASAMVRVADRIVLVDRLAPWRQRSGAPVTQIAQAITARLPDAPQHEAMIQRDDIADPPVRIGSTLGQLTPIRSLVDRPFRSEGCIFVPLRDRGVVALVDAGSRIVTGYSLGPAGMTPRGLSVYSTLRQAKAAYPVGRGSTSDDGRGDISHSWTATNADGTEISFSVGQVYDEDGRIEGGVTVHANTANACRHQFG